VSGVSLKKVRQPQHRADIARLGMRLKLAHAHVLEHALT
jgi:hypothetical protein